MTANRRHTGTIIGIAIILTVVVAACALALPRHDGDSSSLIAVVHDGDGAVHELPLDEDGSVTVETSLGTNTIIVEDGAARVREADCPNHDCMRQNPISRPGQQLVCLPHELWVEVVAPDDAGDGALDTEAVGWNEGDGPTAGVDVDTVAR